MNLKNILFFTLVFSSLTSISSPFQGFLDITNSKGKKIQIYGEGDEFDAVFETKEGYTLLNKRWQNQYFYAIQTEDGSLIPTTVEIGEETEYIPKILTKHLRDTSEKHQKEVQERVEEDEKENHTEENWENLKCRDEIRTEIEEKSWSEKFLDLICSWFGKSPTSKIKFSNPPSKPTTGQVIGLTIMVDFPNGSSTESKVSHKDIDYNHICQMLNSPTYQTTFNKMSVRKFYEGISRGKLDLTNSVIDYVLLDHPRSYYDNTTKDCGDCGRLLISDTFQKLQKRSDWKTKILPMIQGITYDKKTKRFTSLSVMYAGYWPSKWRYGLWPHKYTLSSSPTIKMPNGDQVKFSTYMITYISPYPSMGTFCHESGHMVCSFPDLYDYTSKTRGAGKFSMMAGNNDAAIDPYLAEAAGWITPITLPKSGWVSIPYDRNVVYKYQNPKDKNQYYLIENRQQDGVDYDMPGKGILIWRCNRKGNNTSGGGRFMGKGDNVWRKNFELSLVQADGAYDLERKGNKGSDDDYWKADNINSNYVNEVNDATVPDLVWKDNKPSGLWISKFSKNSTNMTFWVGEPEEKEPVKVKTIGYDGPYDKKNHQITVTPYYPPSGVKIKYSKTKDGRYTTSNPKYKNAGEYVTWFKAEAEGYPSTNGFEVIRIGK